MSIGVINNIQLDYPLIKSYRIPYTRATKFCSGMMFPNNKNFTYAIWDFGDNTGTYTTYFSSASARFNNAIIELNNSISFFPRWEKYASNTIGLALPKFEVIHTFPAAGTYDVSVTLVDTYGNAYQGESHSITVTDDIVPYTVPINWESIAQQYTLTQAADKIFNKGFPSVTSTVTSSISSLPINVDFVINNIIGRVDIDYIQWTTGDGTTHVVKQDSVPVLLPQTQFSYSYKLQSNALTYKPTVTIFIRKGTTKLKFTVAVPEVTIQNRTNIGVSYNKATNETIGTDFAFNIQPVNSYDLPVPAQFIHKITNKLKYIIWDYKDGIIETIPVSYNTAISGINQTLTTTHTYNSLNGYKYLPECIYLYQNDDNTFYSERYQVRNFLNYDLGVITPNNFFLRNRIVSSASNFRYQNNISSLVIYPEVNTSKATAVLRLKLSKSQDILLFEKIVWNINGVEYIQDKNTSETFGYLTIENVTTPFTDFDVLASLYGVPAIFAGTPEKTELVFYDSYRVVFNIYDKDKQEAYNAYLKENVIINPPQFNLDTTIITTATGVEITTPIVESETSVLSSGEETYTGGEYIFDKLFSALNPAANLLNRDYPSTASNFSGNLKTKRDIGFFKPSKASTIIVDPGVFSFFINIENVDFNTPYYFPDPYKYGSDTQVLTFNTVNTSFKKGISFSSIANEPSTNKDSVDGYGYISQNTAKKYEDLSYIYDRGYVADQKHDMYGNTYGLVKNNNNFQQSVEETPVNTVAHILLNGYKFFDELFGEGYTFNYFLTGASGTETIRSGLSSYTNGFTLPGTPYLFNFRRFTPYQDLAKSLEPFDVTTQYNTPLSIGFRDGGAFTFSDDTFLADTISSDLSAYPGAGTFYYTELYEAGTHISSPYQRPLEDDTNAYTQSITGVFSQNVRLSGTNGVLDIDCGRFETVFTTPTFTYTEFLSAVDPAAETTYDTVSSNNDNLLSRKLLEGIIFVKEPNGAVHKLTDSAQYLQTKYTTSVYTELSSQVQEFDLTYNTIFAKTSSYFIIDSIKYEDGQFKNPCTPNNVLNHNTDLFNKLSNRFKVDNSVYFTILSSFNSGSNLVVYPIIYKYDIYNTLLHEIFPANQSITDYLTEFTVASSIRYYEASIPYITYNNDITTFNISYILKDQNKSPLLYSINFEDRNVVTFDSINYYKFTSGNKTVMFATSANLASFVPLISSATPTVSGSLLVL